MSDDILKSAGFRQKYSSPSLEKQKADKFIRVRNMYAPRGKEYGFIRNPGTPKKSRAASGPSIKKILDFFGQEFRHEGLPERETAKNLKEIISDGGRGAMDKINTLIGGHGVEVIRSPDAYDNYYGDAVAEYVNTGDTYNATVVHDIRTGKFLLTTMGDYVEKNEKRYKLR